MTRTVLLFALIGSLADAQAPRAGREGPARGAVEGHLTWFDRQGNRVGAVGEAGVYRTLAVSPDGSRVAAERTEPGTQNRNIWIFDAAGGTSTRLTTDTAWDAFPVWSPDGSRIVFTSNRGGTFDLYQKAVNGGGTDEPFYKSGEGKGPNSWSPDGKYLVYYSIGQPTHLRLSTTSSAASPGDFRRTGAGFSIVRTNRGRRRYPSGRSTAPRERLEMRLSSPPTEAAIRSGAEMAKRFIT
jgi:WD40 repeat protein